MKWVAERPPLGSNPFGLDFPSCHAHKVRSLGLHPGYWAEDPGLRPQNVTQNLSTERKGCCRLEGQGLSHSWVCFPLSLLIRLRKSSSGAWCSLMDSTQSNPAS